MGPVLQAVLGVLGIILLIAAAAFIVVFLSDLVISLVEGRKGIFFSRGENNNEVRVEQKVEEQPKVLTFEDEKTEKGEKVDYDKAELERQLMDEEELALEQRRLQLMQEKEEPVKEEKKENSEDLDALYAQLISDINSEVAEEEKEDVKEETEDSVEDEDIDFDEIVRLINSNNEESNQEEIVEETEEVEPEEIEEVVEETAIENNEEVESLQAQVEELKAMLEKEKEEKERAEENRVKAEEEKANLAKELEEKQIPVVLTEDGESLESLTERKANLEERLKVTEKELKQNKKEFIPLARIQRSLESNEAKLRRKEAIVAKRKIVLFGVNNYVVDPEKEKQLADDLDALEALRLSVQHCQDVMKENEDRYPILENTNKILSKTVEDLKLDLESVNAKIKNMEDADKGSDAGDNNGADAE